MTDFKLTTELNQRIVDGLMDGYREYLEVRREKSRSMKVSGAYAWVKGNHIDDQVSKACKLFGVESKLAKAGLTWQYLQFQHHENKILFIVKNARYFNKEQVSRGKDALGKASKNKMSYMEDLMRINSNIDFKSIPTERANRSIQLELLEEGFLNEQDHYDIGKIKSEFDRFYIVVYAIDESQLISNISLFMPNPKDNKAYLIDDLTKYINASNMVQIDDELREVLINSDDINNNMDAYKFDIGINEEITKKEG
ncbi:hypothetical protein [Ornithinibacillus bavariensis]|uniref:Uncharacterized protein n=1 Tax=Ornithinibacillus bavariensis TaxID=545502 RepID=A0A919X447_9BACI|nr:hypothetical protein [Ornithinibacillus bavariensis]GIO25502.1 hypothetical protein J43TS3_01130 [Ornithinibacillus bavariensis]HAM80606.1 hypothetical protein [Ornithinibacillus sp.]